MNYFLINSKEHIQVTIVHYPGFKHGKDRPRQENNNRYKDHFCEPITIVFFLFVAAEKYESAVKISYFHLKSENGLMLNEEKQYMLRKEYFTLHPNEKVSQIKLTFSSKIKNSIYLHFTVISKSRKCELTYLTEKSLRKKIKRLVNKNMKRVIVKYKTHRNQKQHFSLADPVGCFSFEEEYWHYFIAKLEHLEENDEVYYQISPQSEQLQKGYKKFSFLQNEKFNIIGDLGRQGRKNVSKLMVDLPVSAIIHVGDQSYASNTGTCYGSRYGRDFIVENNFKSAKQKQSILSCEFDCDKNICGGNSRLERKNLERWKAYFEAISNISEGTPWMTTMGNHDNDLPYLLKFRPPHESTYLSGFNYLVDEDMNYLNSIFTEHDNDLNTLQGNAIRVMRNPHFYHFQTKLATFISISTEDNPVNAYEMRGKYDLNNPAPTMKRYQDRWNKHFGKESPQYKWLVQLLKKLNQPEERKNHPWIVVYTHRPLFHTNSHHAMCTVDGDWYGCAFRELYAPLYEKYKVNFVFSGHSHHYMRTHPITYSKENGTKVSEGKFGVVYSVVGTGGFRLDRRLPRHQPSWVAYAQGTSYGLLNLEFYNAEEAQLIFYKASGGDKEILDQITQRNLALSQP
eukprot:snap_masked-scaffold_35-processed-gene-0.0-mRNA-1 protein AED:1.00 eAED:1.00 QI:0/0/0/0/1/1/3/0/624